MKGYRLVLFVPDKMSREKVHHLRALGAEVRMTRSDVGKGHPEYYQDYAERIAKELGAYFINQFANPANPLAHEQTTAPEIWKQMDGRLDAVVCGVQAAVHLLPDLRSRGLLVCERIGWVGKLVDEVRAELLGDAFGVVLVVLRVS